MTKYHSCFRCLVTYRRTGRRKDCNWRYARKQNAVIKEGVYNGECVPVFRQKVIFPAKNCGRPDWSPYGKQGFRGNVAPVESSKHH